MPERVKKQLADRGLLPEDWGGTTVFVDVSAKQKTNLNLLMEMICLVADLQELKATPDRPATGTVVEAKLDRGRGAVATVLVQNGTLRNSDTFIVGNTFGKVRAMFDDRGNQIDSAPPSTPVEILGVELGRNMLHRFNERAPLGTRPRNDSICGAPTGANQPTTSKGTAGQVWVTVKQGGTTLWHFLVVRPAASSGLRGSGVELRYVDYRGKRVLYRAHVPILNVRYDHDACGPYRDWQYEEGEIEANGTDVAPGFRLSPTPAQTIMDTGSDVGNFLGVGIYVQGQEVVLVSEMEAGWYRYINEWRLAVLRTRKPGWGPTTVPVPRYCCSPFWRSCVRDCRIRR